MPDGPKTHFATVRFSVSDWIGGYRKSNLIVHLGRARLGVALVFS